MASFLILYFPGKVGNMGKYKKGDTIPVFLGDSQETHLFVLSCDGDSYEVQVKKRLTHKKSFQDGLRKEKYRRKCQGI